MMIWVLILTLWNGTHSQIPQADQTSCFAARDAWRIRPETKTADCGQVPATRANMHPI